MQSMVEHAIRFRVHNPNQWEEGWYFYYKLWSDRLTGVGDTREEAQENALALIVEEKGLTILGSTEYVLPEDRMPDEDETKEPFPGSKWYCTVYWIE